MFVFVILHYLAYQDTCECVESIKRNIGDSEYKIIIVDNNSPDDSYEKLNRNFSNDKKVFLIHNPKNLGFANGNNVGFRYAKENLNPDFIVLSNNDICLFQPNFSNSVVEFYSKTNFDVMGPMIITKDGNCTSNPEDGHIFNEDEIEGRIKAYKKRYLKSKYYIRNSLTRKINYLKDSMHKESDKNVVLSIKSDVILHGSFMVFSRKYINKFDGLDDKTFMYLEEDILYLHLVKNGMVSYYNPYLAVYHKEDSSTNAMMQSNRKKEMFIAKNQINSFCAYREVLKDYSEKNL